MKLKLYVLSAICISMMVGCSKTARDFENTREMIAGQVVEVEGPEDQYGWFPHLRLTYLGDEITEVYFDYVNGDSEKKSQSEEYNSTMQEKTGTSAELAMLDLRDQLLSKQNVEDIQIVAGATQTSKEFVEMAYTAIDNYQNGNTSANNYGEGDEVQLAISRAKGEAQPEASPESTSTGNETKYFNGGDGNPNSQVASSSGEAEGTGESS